MTATDILKELKSMGKESYKKLLFQNYDVKEPCFGVPISELKKIQKRIKKDYQLALDLYDTGNYDAMYLAGLIADDARMTKKDLNRWVKNGNGGAVCGFTVPWVAAGSPKGYELALEWIDSDRPTTAAAGWTTLGCIVALKDDGDLDLAELKRLLARVQKSIHQAPDAVRYAMNNFVISVGCYVKPLSEQTIAIAEKIGLVTADLGNNNCQVPFAPDYIRKVQQRGTIGKKRKTVKC
jgi:3-methyladenine DNA glycosylase AlkD